MKESDQKADNMDETVSTGELDEKLFDEQTLKNITHEGNVSLETIQERVFAYALRVMNHARVPYAVGAAFARHAYTGIWRTTKDLDIFVKAEDLRAALKALEAAGFETEIEFDHWLAKARWGKEFIDVIFGTGHGQLVMDNSWLQRAQKGEVLGVPTLILSIEEMVALACFVAERSRFDSSEALHLIQGAQGQLDWDRVLHLLGENRQLLLWMLILFDFVYPGHSDYLPQELMESLFNEMRERWKQPGKNPKAFRGAILDPFSYTVDLEDWGYEDRRILTPLVDSKGEPL